MSRMNLFLLIVCLVTVGDDVRIFWSHGLFHVVAWPLFGAFLAGTSLSDLRPKSIALTILVVYVAITALNWTERRTKHHDAEPAALVVSENTFTAGWRSLVPRLAHNQEAVGSNPTPAPASAVRTYPLTATDGGRNFPNKKRGSRRSRLAQCTATGHGAPALPRFSVTA